ncbi:MAG: FAD-binding oxidoreductase [Pirellulaceae bacterium]
MNPISQNHWEKLAAALSGELRWNEGARGVYATDASVYQQFPHAVAIPKNENDVEAILAFCREHRMPVIGRGGGTSLSGQAIGAGIVIDFSQHMNRILEIDRQAMTATVEPGVVLDELNAELAPHGLLFAPDPATASRATIGGMIGNNACGTRSIVFGRTCDSIESLRCLLADGSWMETQWNEPRTWRDAKTEQPLIRTFQEIIDRHRDSIARQIPDLPRMAAGYSLQYFVNEDRPKSFSDLFVGSEGTLAIATGATLRLKRLPTATSLVIMSFPSIDQSLRALPAILNHQPSAIELLDDVLLKEAVRNSSTRDLSKVVVTSSTVPAAVLMVEFLRTHWNRPANANDLTTIATRC